MKYFALVTLAILVNLQVAFAGDEPSQSERARMAVQKVCPVSGQQLGAHGKPVRVRIGEEVVYLCCEGCLSGKVSQQHWAAIHANFAKAQGKCPVMNKPLPENPKWTVVDGRIVYVCCPPCTEKIAAEREKYLKMVDEFYVAYLNAQRKPPR